MLHNFLCPLPATFARFFLCFYSHRVFSLSLSFSRVLRGTRKRMPLSASSFSRCARRLIPASDLRIVHPIARLFSHYSHWYQDLDIRIWCTFPSLHGGHGSNGRSLVTVGLEALFYVSTPTFLFLASGNKSREGREERREREKEREKLVSLVCVYVRV